MSADGMAPETTPARERYLARVREAYAERGVPLPVPLDGRVISRVTVGRRGEHTFTRWSCSWCDDGIHTPCVYCRNGAEQQAQQAFDAGYHARRPFNPRWDER